MADVKGKLREILNTNLGGGNLSTDFNTISSTSAWNKKSYNCQSKSSDLSFDNFKKGRNSSKGKDSLNLSGFLSNNRNNNSKYTPISTQSSNPPLSTKSNNQIRLFNFNNHPNSNSNFLANFELICPPSNSPLYFSKLSTEKIRKEIETVHKEITKGKTQFQGYRNRPALNLDRQDLEFNPREIFATSPTVTRRSLLTTSSYSKKYKNNNSSYSYISTSKLISKNDFKSLAQNNKREFDEFVSDFVPNKSSVQDHFLPRQVKKKFK